MQVGRDGASVFLTSGPSTSGGSDSAEPGRYIESRVARQMIGVRAAVSMGDTRSIRVFVLGEANRPGSYTISGLGTITSALYAAGGVKPIGSLRSIQLQAPGRAGTAPRSVRSADSRRHHRRRQAAAGRRDLHSAGGSDRECRRRGAAARRSTSRARHPPLPMSCELAGGLTAGGGQLEDRC